VSTAFYDALVGTAAGAGVTGVPSPASDALAWKGLRTIPTATMSTTAARRTGPAERPDTAAWLVAMDPDLLSPRPPTQLLVRRGRS
jgi:hypothetical protein